MAGQKGKRFSLPNARIMIHQPSGGAQGQATDIEIHAKEILLTRARLNQMYVTHTGRTIDEIERAMERDKFFSPAGSQGVRTDRRRARKPADAPDPGRRFLTGAATNCLPFAGRHTIF